jgi:regulator of replication initiation timing
MKTTSLPETNSLAEQVQCLLASVECLRNDVSELRQENSDLRQQVRELQCEVGCWKSRHADAVQRNVKLQAELDQAKAEIRQLKSERFGKRSEKQSSTDRSNELIDPQAPVASKNQRKR